MIIHPFTESGDCHECGVYQRNATVASIAPRETIHLCDTCIELVRLRERTKVKAKNLVVRALRRATGR